MLAIVINARVSADWLCIKQGDCGYMMFVWDLLMQTT